MAAQKRLEKELRRCLRVLIRRYQPDRVLLFGSLAAGSAHRYSDIDLIIVKQTSQPFGERISAESETRYCSL
jgi:predicted nucleotidyltransferase